MSLLNEGAADTAVALSGLPAGAWRRFTLLSVGGLADADPAHVSVQGATMGVDERWSAPVVPEGVDASGDAAMVAVPARAAVLMVGR